MNTSFIRLALFCLASLMMVGVGRAQVTCPPISTPPPDRVQLDVTADTQYFLYVDGQITGDEPNFDNATAADRVILPPLTRLIAINGQLFDSQGGILASVSTSNGNYLLTSSQWKCFNRLVAGWDQLGFDDSAWPAATQIGLNGNNPVFDYGCIAGISPDAYWIWTSAFSGGTRDRNAFCRGYLPLCTQNNPCRNGGTCFPNSAILCRCPPDYSGGVCEIDLNPCRSSPCVNGGTCLNGPEGFQCLCNGNYTGSRCETMLNACESAPCLNGATCLNGGTFYRCQCSPYYTGSRCETELPPSCGAILRTAQNPSLPSGWDLGCYLGVGDEVFWNTPCYGLLQGLSYFGSSDQLLAAGGNYGCWTSRGSTSADIYNACTDDYQHNVYIRECASCDFMAVCIRFPPKQSDDEAIP